MDEKSQAFSRTTNSEIEELEIKLAKLKQQEEYKKSLNKQQKLAIFLHSKFCKGHGMSTVCDWNNEVKSVNGEAQHDWYKEYHASWLVKAAEVLTVVDSNIPLEDWRN